MSSGYTKPSWYARSITEELDSAYDREGISVKDRIDVQRIRFSSTEYVRAIQGLDLPADHLISVEDLEPRRLFYKLAELEADMYRLVGRYPASDFLKDDLTDVMVKCAAARSLLLATRVQGYDWDRGIRNTFSHVAGILRSLRGKEPDMDDTLKLNQILNNYMGAQDDWWNFQYSSAAELRAKIEEEKGKES